MTNDIEIKNAKIDHTMLGFEEHGVFSFSLGLDYGGLHQGCGHIALDEYNQKRDERDGWEYGIDLLARIMKVVGVDSWEGIKGKHIRVKSNHSEVYAIGNLLSDEWLNFDEFCKRHKR